MALLERACSLHSAGVRAAMLQTVPIEDGVALAGEVDLSNVSVLRAALAAGCARLPEDSASFVVDLASPSFLDVAGARALVTGTSQLRHRGVAVQLRFAAPLVSLLLRQLGVDAIDGLILEEA